MVLEELIETFKLWDAHTKLAFYMLAGPRFFDEHMTAIDKMNMQSALILIETRKPPEFKR